MNRFYLLATAIVLCLVNFSCSDDKPKEPRQNDFKKYVAGHIWELEKTQFFTSSGEEYFVITHGGDKGILTPYGGNFKHKAYLFNEDSFIFFYELELKYTVHPSGLEYKEFSGTFNPDDNIMHPSGITYYDVYSYNHNERDEIFFESITEDEIVIRMDYGVLWKSIPDKNIHNPDRHNADPGSYTRRTLRRVPDYEEANWWRDYISQQERLDLLDQLLNGEKTDQ